MLQMLLGFEALERHQNLLKQQQHEDSAKTFHIVIYNNRYDVSFISPQCCTVCGNRGGQADYDTLSNPCR